MRNSTEDRQRMIDDMNRRLRKMHYEETGPTKLEEALFFVLMAAAATLLVGIVGCQLGVG